VRRSLRKTTVRACLGVGAYSGREGNARHARRWPRTGERGPRPATAGVSRAVMRKVLGGPLAARGGPTVAPGWIPGKGGRGLTNDPASRGRRGAAARKDEPDRSWVAERADGLCPGTSVPAVGGRGAGGGGGFPEKGWADLCAAGRGQGRTPWPAPNGRPSLVGGGGGRAHGEGARLVVGDKRSTAGLVPNVVGGRSPSAPRTPFVPKFFDPCCWSHAPCSGLGAARAAPRTRALGASGPTTSEAGSRLLGKAVSSRSAGRVGPASRTGTVCNKTCAP